MCIVYTVYSQSPKSQRMVLVEEFSNASCGPCASQNPAFNTLLQANPTKVIPLKYQWDYPGYDPMNAQNPTEPDTRIGYYGFSGVPTGIVDGRAIDSCSGAYLGCPACLKQVNINSEALVSSPFTIDLSHTLSPDYDSIFITMIITATEAVNVTGPFKAHVAITENKISFLTAPGANGEKEFYNVMRKMLPGVQGTTLTNTWIVGQESTLTFAVPLPTYIYDYSQVAVVAFLQDDATKNVKQAAFSANRPLSIDAGLASPNPITNISTLNCVQNIVPSITIKNYGTTPITSAVIKYRIDSNGDSIYNWNGSINSLASSTFALPQITFPLGSHTLTVSINNPNASVDYNSINNSANLSLIVIGNYFPMPITETFTSTTFPPTNWIKEDVDKDNVGWSRKSGTGPGSCAKIDFYNSPEGNIDNLYTPPLNLTSPASVFLLFNYAHAQYSSSYIDKLEVQVSIDCGGTWNPVWSKEGSDLATRAALPSLYSAPVVADWVSTYADLSSYVGQANVFVRFSGISGFGNNAFIDNIQIVLNNNTSISENTDNTSVIIYPNPLNDYTNINIKLVQQSNVNYKVYNTTGSLVYYEDAGSLSAGNHSIRFSSDNLSSGIYSIQIMIGNDIITQKISINK